jgi:hypothetical protein
MINAWQVVMSPVRPVIGKENPVHEFVVRYYQPIGWHTLIKDGNPDGVVDRRLFFEYLFSGGHRYDPTLS